MERLRNYLATALIVLLAVGVAGYAGVQVYQQEFAPTNPTYTKCSSLVGEAESGIVGYPLADYDPIEGSFKAPPKINGLNVVSVREHPGETGFFGVKTRTFSALVPDELLAQVQFPQDSTMQPDGVSFSGTIVRVGDGCYLQVKTVSPIPTS